jgi:hypothetical protein
MFRLAGVEDGSTSSPQANAHPMALDGAMPTSTDDLRLVAGK